MKVVYKYTLPFQDEVELALPPNAEVLSVGNQDEHLVLWARVDDSAPVGAVKRTFRIVGTGHPNAIGRFIGTALFMEGRLVFHVFEG